MTPDDLIDEAALQCDRHRLAGSVRPPDAPSVVEVLRNVARGMAAGRDRSALAAARQLAVEHWIGQSFEDPTAPRMRLVAYVLAWAEAFAPADRATQARAAASAATGEASVVLQLLRRREFDVAQARRAQAIAMLLPYRADALAAAIELAPVRAMRMASDWGAIGVIARQMLTEALGLRLQDG